MYHPEPLAALALRPPNSESPLLLLFLVSQEVASELPWRDGVGRKGHLELAVLLDQKSMKCLTIIHRYVYIYNIVYFLLLIYEAQSRCRYAFLLRDRFLECQLG